MTALPALEIADVIALTLEGSGVLAPAGKRVLVPGALVGEEVAFQRRRRRRNYDEGLLVEVRRPSADRVTPACEYFGRCGGCSLQHLSPAAQLAMKQGTLLESLARIASLEPAEVLAPVRGAVWGYRRRARLAVRHVERKGRVLVGFREAEKPWVVDMLTCATVDPAISRLIAPLSALIGKLSLRARLPQVEATVADNATALVFRVLDSPTPADREELLRFATEQGVRVYLQPGNPDSVVALDPAGFGEELHYRLPAFDLTLTFGPTDFIQVHGEVNRLMVDQALRLLAPAGADRVLDLYCGMGNFTLPLARVAGTVLGLEGASPAVKRGRDNAVLAGLPNARFVEADLAGAGAEGAWTREKFDLAVLDPPRTGAAELLPALGKVAPRRILYVSCHPGTLARDAGLLVREHGYRLASAGVMDMFPHTSHVESMALFEHG
ncbi:MAG: 23S rRNA (uracil(1939)-C(5))-methyltransferase RlmD [Gammaproteobacteria bacterium]